MPSPTIESVAKSDKDALLKSGQVAEKLANGDAAALADSGKAAHSALQELTKAYQEMATRNVNTMTAALKALSGVKSPAEFMALQQSLTQDAVTAAVSDGQQIAQLTAAVFTAGFEPVKKRLDVVQNSAR